MPRYLLVDSTRARRSPFIEEIAQATNDLLVVRSDHDREMRDLLDQVRLDSRYEPTLLEVDGPSVRAFTGFSLTARLIAVLGLRRAWRVAQLVAELQTPLLVPMQSRRGLLARGGHIAAGVVGLTLLGPVPHGVMADDVGTEGKKKPGKYSRQEGIKEWKVKETDSGYKVDFEHKKKKVSGELKVSFTDQGRTGTMILKRDKERFEMAFSGRQLAATDSEGKSMVARWDTGQNKWHIDAQSEKRFDDNRRDFNICAAIASDLAEVWAKSASAAADVEAVVAARQGTCNGNKTVREWNGALPEFSKSISCDLATQNTEQECIDVGPGHCKGCCRLLDGCDCQCLSQDYFCWCSRVGHPYDGLC